MEGCGAGGECVCQAAEEVAEAEPLIEVGGGCEDLGDLIAQGAVVGEGEVSGAFAVGGMPGGDYFPEGAGGGEGLEFFGRDIEVGGEGAGIALVLEPGVEEDVEGDGHVMTITQGRWSFSGLRKSIEKRAQTRHMG